MPRFSLQAALLTALTQKSSSLTYSDAAADAPFQDIKHALIYAPVLIPPDWTKVFPVHIDASQLAVGATLTKYDANSHARAIAYTSRKLNSAEQNYTANERE